MKKLTKDLVNLGFTEVETKVYLYIVDELEVSAYQIGKDLAMPRATAYKILERLKKKGVVLETKKNGTKHYFAESYGVLTKNLKDKLSVAESLIPLLKARSRIAGAEKPITKMYTSKKGMTLIWEDMIEEYSKNKPPRIYVSTNLGLFENVPNVMKYITARRELGTVANVIYPESQRGSILGVTQKSNDNFRFIPDAFSYNGEVTVYGNKVALFSFDKNRPLSIVVESKEIAEMVQGLLKALWAGGSE